MEESTEGEKGTRIEEKRKGIVVANSVNQKETYSINVQ